MQGSRGRGPKGPPVYRGLSVVQGSHKYQQTGTREQSPIEQNKYASHHVAHLGEAIPTTMLQTNWASKPSSYDTLEAVPGAQRAAATNQKQQNDAVLQRSLNTMTVGEARRGLSKSTLRSDVRSNNDQITTMKKPGNNHKGPGTRSVRRSRPTISQISQSTAIHKNAKIRRNQTSANIRKVQLKKTIQQATYQDNQSDP